MKFIAFDLETTGFKTGTDRIIEIGAARFDESGEVEALFSTLIDPQMEIPEDATKTNGITNEMVAGKPTIDKILNPFAEFCEDTVLVAHNSPFDVRFLKFDIEQYFAKSPLGIVLDNLPLSRKAFVGLENYKLGTIVNHLKIKAGDFHRAKADALMCGAVFKEVLFKLSVGDRKPPIEKLVAMTGKQQLRLC